MKKVFLILPLIGIYYLSFSQSKENTEIAKELITHLEKGKMEIITAFFDENMKKALSEDKLKFVWDDLIKMCGEFEKYSEISAEKIDNYDVVYILCHFKNFNLRMKTVFNTRQQVSGLFFIPPEIDPEKKL